MNNNEHFNIDERFCLKLLGFTITFKSSNGISDITCLLVYINDDIHIPYLYTFSIGNPTHDVVQMAPARSHIRFRLIKKY